MFWGIRINNYLCLISSISSEIVEIERDKKNAMNAPKRAKYLRGGRLYTYQQNK